MKKIFYLISSGLFLVILFTVNHASAQGTLRADSISMGPGYASEVYYSMANGNVKTVLRDQWDIAFRTGIMSSSILTNDGTGVTLYTYPKADTAGWATVDTSGLFSWPQMFNDPNDWENGAFSRNAKGHPDYGWGIYNQQTHNLTGDSIFIIQLRDGSFKKLWIRMKHSSADTYDFRYANLDGTNDQTISLNLTTYQSVDFYGYDLKNNVEVDFQPAKDSWDILFTKYKGINTGLPYTVTGVLSNDKLMVKRVAGVPWSFNNWWQNEYDSTRSVIGYDWKTFDGTGYSVDDSLVFFIQNKAGDIYKLYFTKFEGSATGKVVFNIGKVSSVGIQDQKPLETGLSVFPNPAGETITVATADLPQGDLITLMNLSGQVIQQKKPAGTQTTFDVSKINPGIYFIRLVSPQGTTSKKIIISR
ncbi:MAG TPA: T9SS type A sorting domain-containing protein [Bacteroidales bacterium]|nr:T9SS type A sorting domain-containing protein [Bacteroidales bacterium]